MTLLLFALWCCVARGVEMCCGNVTCPSLLCVAPSLLGLLQPVVAAVALPRVPRRRSRSRSGCTRSRLPPASPTSPAAAGEDGDLLTSSFEVAFAGPVLQMDPFEPEFLNESLDTPSLEIAVCILGMAPPHSASDEALPPAAFPPAVGQ